jgi:hypothetical protein
MALLATVGSKAAYKIIRPAQRHSAADSSVGIGVRPVGRKGTLVAQLLTLYRIEFITIKPLAARA